MDGFASAADLALLRNSAKTPKPNYCWAFRCRAHGCTGPRDGQEASYSFSLRIEILSAMSVVYSPVSHAETVVSRCAGPARTYSRVSSYGFFFFKRIASPSSFSWGG